MLQKAFDYTISTINLLNIPDFILKLYVFNTYLMRVISLMTGKMVPSLARAIERTTTLSTIFS